MLALRSLDSFRLAFAFCTTQQSQLLGGTVSVPSEIKSFSQRILHGLTRSLLRVDQRERVNTSCGVC